MVSCRNTTQPSALLLLVVEQTIPGLDMRLCSYSHIPGLPGDCSLALNFRTFVTVVGVPSSCDCMDSLTLGETSPSIAPTAPDLRVPHYTAKQLSLHSNYSPPVPPNLLTLVYAGLVPRLHPESGNKTSMHTGRPSKIGRRAQQCTLHR